jgi:alginate O-acetyltransferase complex protein AlgI
MLWLATASVFFYAWWSPHYALLMLGSIVVNYLCAKAIGHRAVHTQKHLLLIAAIAFDLGLLSYYKYTNFFISTINSVSGNSLSPIDILLPIGISFFTFTQIAFLVDVYCRRAEEYDFTRYVLFVTFFPHLIAGPVLHHKEMMPQFAEPATYRLHLDNVTIGITIFTIGLAKKVLLADGFGSWASPVFDSVEAGTQPTFLVAWVGALAYTFQIYFDLSGYSDMAIGISRMFGIKLPLNFNSPYKAMNIAEFWHRWHMTLSRFLRDYLYIPLGGNRGGGARRYLNLLITMLLGGLWHGSNWTFVLWGGLHGIYLVIFHIWNSTIHDRSWTSRTFSYFQRLLAWSTTFLGVVVAWVFFRALTVNTAMDMLRGMAGLNGVRLPKVCWWWCLCSNMHWMRLVLH